VVDLLEPKAAASEDIFHSCCVSGCVTWICVERLDHGSDATRCDSSCNKGRAAPRESKPASMPMPRVKRRSHKSRMPSSP
jgi:hypothetical protein